MSEHLKLMYKFWMTNSLGKTGPISDDDIATTISYSMFTRKELDMVVKRYYINFQGKVVEQEVA